MTIRFPMMTGDTLGSTVVWKWNRASSRFEATLEDGSRLWAIFRKRGQLSTRKAGRDKPGYWTASVLGAWTAFWSDIGMQQPFADADAAKRAAFDWYMTNRPAQAEKGKTDGRRSRH